MDRKRELKEEYKQMKHDMGLIIIHSKFNNKYCLETSQNLRATMNSVRFKLNGGAYINEELQQAWKEHGEDNFLVEILEKLDYDEDESKTDYKEDLKILQEIWEDKLKKEGNEPYIKTL